MFFLHIDQIKEEFFCDFRKAIDLIGPTKYFWIASAGVSQTQSNLLEEMKKTVFHDFEFPVLKYPLRNQKKIVQFALAIQDSGENVKSGYYNNVTTSFEMDIPSNLAEGAQVITIDGGRHHTDLTLTLSNKRILTPGAAAGIKIYTG